MRLADAPQDAANDGATITLPLALLRDSPRLQALFAPFRECVVLHETLLHDGSTARATRLLMAEIRSDSLDDVRVIVRQACPSSHFDEKATELDDVADGTEWKERSGPLAVAAYRLFGGSTSLHVTSGKVDPPEAPMEALLASPLAILAELVGTTSFVESVSCSRNAGAAPQWHLHAKLRDMRRFEEIAPRLLALGFEERSDGRRTYWRDQVIVQPLAKERWMAAFPGIELAR